MSTGERPLKLGVVGLGYWGPNLARNFAGLANCEVSWLCDASGEARGGADAMSKVAGVSTDARTTASDVKDLADAVAVEAENLEAEVRQFLTNVQAA